MRWFEKTLACWSTILYSFQILTGILFTGQRLIKNMAPLFENISIEPCLLHGDLWSGNISSDKNGEPVILDPACYCKSLSVSINLCIDRFLLPLLIYSELDHFNLHPNSLMLQNFLVALCLNLKEFKVKLLWSWVIYCIRGSMNLMWK